jgi:hypothetical protein
MIKAVKPSRNIRSPKVAGTISKTVLRNAVKKVAEKRTDSNKKTPSNKKNNYK